MDPSDYDNPKGSPLLVEYGIPNEAYGAVFDFGCGCGRQARQLLQQRPRPARYVGIDIHPALIAWCQANLAPVDPGFAFAHHDVYSPSYAPRNSLRLAVPFPVEDEAFSLVLANSVFTHLTRGQAEYYLSEVARILTPEGIAFTSWLFFDRASFQFLPDVYALYVSEIDFSLAVLFDREWFLATVRRLGLAVKKTIPPQIPGYQWVVVLVKRAAGMIDDFPLGADAAEWVSGASLKPIATSTMSPEEFAKYGLPHEVRVGDKPPAPPGLECALAELHHTRAALHHTRAALDWTDAELRTTRATWAWTIGRALTSPMRFLRRFF